MNFGLNDHQKLKKMSKIPSPASKSESKRTNPSTELPEVLQAVPQLSGKPKIAIVGAGISGMMSALFLHFAGAEVTLFDRHQAAQEASWAGGGIVSPMYPWRYPDAVNDLATVSQQHFPALVEWLKNGTGIDPELLDSGMLMLDGEEAFEAEVWCKRYGHKLEVLAPEFRNLVEPRLESSAELALWMPEIKQVRNPRLMKSLKTALSQLAIPILESTPVQGMWQASASRTVKGVEAEVKGKLQKLPFDQVVITTGAWTADLVPEAEIYPVKGQMLLFDTTPGFLKHMVMEKGRYIIPRKDGRVLVGSTVEPQAGFDKTTTAEAEAELKAFAFEHYPELRMFEMETHWAGLRPGKENAVPYICQHPNYDNVYLNAGHFRNGVVLSIGAAQLLMQIISKQAISIDPLHLIR